MTALGASFSPRRARDRGLAWEDAFRRLLVLELSPLRLSTYWDGVELDGYGEVDWLLDECDRAGRQVVLTVGMKAQAWPEFAIPGRLNPAARSGADVSGAAGLRDAVLALVETTVERYRGRRCVVAWQIENEPVNRSGPRRWWIGAELVRDEIAAARRVDPSRPIVVNAFAAFNAFLDAASQATSSASTSTAASATASGRSGGTPTPASGARTPPAGTPGRPARESEPGSSRPRRSRGSRPSRPAGCPSAAPRPM
jgi:hypothetical protein